MPKQPRPKMYWELAPWFHLVTHPRSYAGEVRWVRRQLLPRPRAAKPTMLELGSGGGTNALHLKKHFQLTLTDLSPHMLSVSREINPDCEHITGDMRTLRLKRQFDVVFAHDAISYITTVRDLQRTIATVFAHCRPGGVALLQPDDVRETFRPSRDSGGHRIDGRAVRYVELTHPLKPGRDSTTVDYTLMLKDRNGTTRKLADRHHIGVFARAVWLDVLRAQGFRARAIVDPWKRVCFLAQRPLTECDTPTQNNKTTRTTRSKP
ncbi:MAG: class I SAM-dependent methyltransferase [Micropepsaceae bacterium]